VKNFCSENSSLLLKNKDWIKIGKIGNYCQLKQLAAIHHICENFFRYFRALRVQKSGEIRVYLRFLR